MRTLIPLIALSTGCFVGGGDHTWTFDDVRTVEIELGSGDVHVQTDPDATSAFIRWSGGGIGGENAVRPDVQCDDGQITIDADGGALSGGDLDVVVPEGVDVIARVDRGDLSMELDVAVDVDACVGAGAIELRVPAGGYVMDLDVGAGALEMYDVAHNPQAEHHIQACVGAGDLAIYGM